MEAVKLKELNYTEITHQAIPSNNGKDGELERSAKLAITDHYAPYSHQLHTHYCVKNRVLDVG